MAWETIDDIPISVPRRTKRPKSSGLSKIEFLEFRKRKFKNRTILNPKTNCWEWKGKLMGKYGPHRFFFWLFKGINPGNLEIHHSCKNQKCVNPDHLEAVTFEEHQKRHGKLSIN